MKKISLILLSFVILLISSGCNKNSIKGKSFMYEDMSVYYTDRRGNLIEFDKDNYNYFEIEKQKKEGYIITNYLQLKNIYNFVTDSIVEYKYIKDGTTNNSYKCEYNIEHDKIIIKCKDNIELFKFSDDSKCIIDEYERKYCIET